jgi:hypothetical protein
MQKRLTLGTLTVYRRGDGLGMQGVYRFDGAPELRWASRLKRPAGKRKS